MSDLNFNAGAAPDVFMFCPGGDHLVTMGTSAINAQRTGIQALELEVTIAPITAREMNSQLAMLKNRGKNRPFFDFEHKGWPAAFYPVEFLWLDEPLAGVYVAGVWSERGRAAIEARRYDWFSPVFSLTSGALHTPIADALAPMAMGGFTNLPAFTAIRPVMPPFFIEEKKSKP